MGKVHRDDGKVKAWDEQVNELFAVAIGAPLDSAEERDALVRLSKLLGVADLMTNGAETENRP